MFGKLKEKLKGALSVFSRKTQEEAETKVEEKAVEQPKEETKEAVEEQREETKEEAPVEEIKEKVAEKEQPEELPPPVKKLKETAEPAEEEKPEEKEAPVEEEKPVEKEIPIPERYDVAKHKFEPDLEKIKEIKEELTEEKTEEISETKEEPQKEKSSFFGRLKQSITTKTISGEKFDELFWDLEVVLLEHNVSLEVVEKIKQDLKAELVDKPLPRDVPKKIEETLKKTLTEIVSFEPVDLLKKIQQKKEKPYVIDFFGINGSGKTTTIAKLSYLLQQKGLKTVLAASDTFRAAAIQQLEEHADKLNTKIIKHEYGSDAAAVAFDAIKYAQKNALDVVLVDTAGRLHSNVNLMDELKKIVKVTNPDFKIFVGEAITGNDCIEQARKFDELVDIDAVILAKADVDEKGGAPLSIAYTIKKPIIYLGMGQNYSDLEKFDANTVLSRLGF